MIQKFVTSFEKAKFDKCPKTASLNKSIQNLTNQYMDTLLKQRDPTQEQVITELRKNQWEALYIVVFNTYLVKKKFVIIDKNDGIKFDKLIILSAASAPINDADLKLPVDVSVVEAYKLSPLKGIEKLLEQTSPDDPLLSQLPIDKPETKEQLSIYSQDYTEMTQEEEEELWKNSAKGTKQ